MIYKYTFNGNIIDKILINLKSYKYEETKLWCTDTWL